MMVNPSPPLIPTGDKFQGGSGHSRILIPKTHIRRPAYIKKLREGSSSETKVDRRIDRFD